MSVVDQSGAPTHSSVDAVAGLLAVASFALSGIAAGLGLLLQIEARPVRVIPVALVLAIVAGRMSERFERLALAAVIAAMIAWVFGMTLVVLTENPLV
jgi:hypothetical protein